MARRPDHHRAALLPARRPLRRAPASRPRPRHLKKTDSGAGSPSRGALGPRKAFSLIFRKFCGGLNQPPRGSRRRRQAPGAAAMARLSQPEAIAADGRSRGPLRCLESANPRQSPPTAGPGGRAVRRHAAARPAPARRRTRRPPPEGDRVRRACPACSGRGFSPWSRPGGASRRSRRSTARGRPAGARRPRARTAGP